MADLTSARIVTVKRKTIKKIVYPLAAVKVIDGTIACIDTANLGFVTKVSVATTLKAIGWFQATVDNSGGSAGALGVGIELFRERECQIWDSVTGGGAITAASLFATVYLADNHTLTTVSTGASAYGIVWDFGPQGYSGGVVVEPLF